MGTPDPIDDYLKELRRRLRWRRGGRRIAEEVEDHLREVVRRAQSEGAGGEDAVRLAIERVGNPASVVAGRQRATVIAVAAVAVFIAASVGLVAVDRSHPAASAKAGYHLSPAQARIVARQVALIDQGYTRGYHQVSLAYAVGTARFPVFLPDAPMANSRNVQSAWSLYGEGIAVNVVYRSAVMVLEQRWNPHTSAPDWLRHGPGRFMYLDGAPAKALPSRPPKPATWQGIGFPLPEIVLRFGTASIVYVVRDNTYIMLLRWGRNTLPGLIRVARTLRLVKASQLPASATRYVSVGPHCLGGPEMPIPRRNARIINRTSFPAKLNGCPVVTPDRPLHRLL